MAEAAKKLVDQTIQKNPVVVFSKSYCPYCTKAKRLLTDSYTIPTGKISIVEIEDREDCDAIQAYLKELTGASSVPRVFVKSNCIGGCDDTFKLHETGELKRLIDEALSENKN